jgi:uncharacterized protein YndB with AHSA1/START domain
MTLVLEQELPCTPEVAWLYVTSPSHMALWSLAAVRPLDVGDGGGMDGVGALREVSIQTPVSRTAFTEVIEHAERPERLVYRAFEGLPVRYHRGEITLRPTGPGHTLLRWKVNADFLWPGMQYVAWPLLERQLRESLLQLARRVRPEPVPPVTAPRRLEEEQDLSPLYSQASLCLEEQQRTAEALQARDDPKHLFTRVYQYVTEEQLARCRSGEVTHEGWVLRLIPRFHAYYFDNLRAWQGPHPERTEPAWSEAFRAMDASRGQHTFQGLVGGLLLGVKAHVEEDLPRVLVEVYQAHYATRCDFVRFRADYLLMGDLFRRASERLLNGFAPRALPRSIRVLRAVAPDHVRDAWLSARYYDVRKRRQEAFERAARSLRGAPH